MRVFEDLNLVIQKGEFVAVLGENGSGKSTLARMLNGLLIPDSGSVEVDGFNTRKTDDMLEIRRRAGLLLPNADNQLFSSLVEENVAFGPENLGLDHKEIKTRVNDALQKVSMEDFAKYPPNLLSGGQKQLVALAGILALKPDYLILDEPAAMLDGRGQQEIGRVLLSLYYRQGISLIWITHNIGEVKDADRFLIMKNGQLIEYKSLEDLAVNSDLMVELGIEPLEISQLIASINSKARTAVTQHITSVGELVEELCRLK